MFPEVDAPETVRAIREFSDMMRTFARAAGFEEVEREWWTGEVVE